MFLFLLIIDFFNLLSLNLLPFNFLCIFTAICLLFEIVRYIHCTYKIFIVRKIIAKELLAHLLISVIKDL